MARTRKNLLWVCILPPIFLVIFLRLLVRISSRRPIQIRPGRDDSRIRKDHAPENIMMVRHAALNLLKLLDHRFDLLTGRCSAETEPNRAHADLRCHSHGSQDWGHLN